jgi:hypothetical protein
MKSIRPDGDVPARRGRPRGVSVNGRLLPTTTRVEYRRHILRLLRGAQQCAMSSREVRRCIYEHLRNRFTEADLERLRWGQVRWAINMQWVRKELVLQGLLEPALTAGHGRWVLTARGVREAQSI